MKNKWWESNIDPDISKSLIKLKSKLSGKSVTRNWTEDLSLDYDNLDEDMEQIPSILAFWSAVLAEARREKSLNEMKMDIRRSKILKSISDNMQEGVKLTVKDKDDIVKVDQEWNKLRAAEIEIDVTISKLFGIVDALKIKADNLRSFSSMKRAELHNT